MPSRAEPRRRRDAGGRTTPGPWLPVFLLAVTLRFAAGWWWRDTSALRPDPRLAEIATHLVRGGGFALTRGVTRAATAAVPPLPPALLSGVYGLAGVRPWLELALACVIGGLAALAVARLATVLYGASVGRVAAVCAALSPMLLRTSSLLEESVFSLTLVFALVASAEWLRTPRGGRAFGAGLAWGATALSGTMGLLLPPLVLAWTWRPLGLELPGAERRRQAGLALLGLACVVGAWAGRNAVAMRAWAPVSTSSGIAVLAANNDVTWRQPELRGGRLDVARVEPWASRLGARREASRDSLAWAEALAFAVTRTPAEYARVAGARFVRLWSPGPVPDAPPLPVRGARPIAERILELAEAALLGFGAWGAVRALSGPRRWFQSLPVSVLLACTAAAMLVTSSSRVRVGIEPLVALLAAVGVHQARRLLRSRGRDLHLVRGRNVPATRPDFPA